MARPRRSESTRAALITAGINQLSIHGYHGTGIKQILDEVNVPKGSFYNFFESKEAFVAELITYYSNTLLQQLNNFFNGQGRTLSPLLKLKSINELSLKSFADKSFKQSCLIATLSADIDGDNHLCQQALLTSVDRCHQLITDLFTQAQQQNEVRNDLPAQQLARLFWSTWQGTLIRMKVLKDMKEAQCTMNTLLATLGNTLDKT